jgi:DNA repair photolyase
LDNSELLFGTHEWAEENCNFINGCSHDCMYCYSKEMAIRFKRKTPGTWKDEEVRSKCLNKKYALRKGTIMFPSSHDITPKFLNETLHILNNILEYGNNVLIVTKPHMECIQKICESFINYKDKILFRFTIGSSSNNVLKFWEPGAPAFEERLECLRHAYEHGYQTSVSCEPMLDKYIDRLIDQLLPYITETIWIGKANFLIKRMRTNGISDKESFHAAEELYQWQNNIDNIFKLYRRYCDNPKIKWKESIKKVLNESALVD